MITTCEICGNDFDTVGNGKTCGKECRTIYKRNKNRVYMRKYRKSKKNDHEYAEKRRSYRRQYRLRYFKRKESSVKIMEMLMRIHVKMCYRELDWILPACLKKWVDSGTIKQTMEMTNHEAYYDHEAVLREYEGVEA